MRKNLTEIINIFQSIAVQPKNLIVENHRQNNAAAAMTNVDGTKQQPQSLNTSLSFSALDGPVNGASGVGGGRSAQKQQKDHQLRETWDEIKKLSENGPHHHRSSSKDKLVFNGSRSKRDGGGHGGKDKGKDKKSGKKQQHQHAETCGVNFFGGKSNSHGDKNGGNVPADKCDCLPVLEMLGRRIEADRKAN